MKYNPAYPTTYPNGHVHLLELFFPGSVSSPLFLWTWMTSLPYVPYKRFGYSINERNWNYKDCCSAGKHLQNPGQTHGWNNSPASFNHHIGNLWPLVSNPAGNAWQFQYANRPSFSTNGGTQPSIYGKTMTVHEFGDDYGFGDPYSLGYPSWDSRENGSMGPRIACCTIKRYQINWEDARDDSASRGRGLADDLDVEVFTVGQFRELFGMEPERLPGDPGYNDQN